MIDKIQWSIKYTSLDFLSSLVDVICHATEDKQKILNSIQRILLISEDKFQESEYEGHWGNTILKMTALLNRKDTNALVKRIFEEISFNDRENLLSNLENHIDHKGNLFLRVDKQMLCRNRLRLTENEGIKLRFKPNKNKIIEQKRSNKIDDEIYAFYRRLIQFTEK